jgi:hypothetical protein
MLMTSCAGVDLDDSPNVGPCPVAGTLYDASRVVDIDGPERHENVVFTGEIQGLRGFCRYVGTNPITMEIEIDFAFGKGPKATASSHTYPVFVTVTRRDRSVLAKERFDIQVACPPARTSSATRKPCRASLYLAPMKPFRARTSRSWSALI